MWPESRCQCCNSRTVLHFWDMLTAGGRGGVGVVLPADNTIPLPDLHDSILLVRLLHLEGVCLLGLKQLRLGRGCLILEDVVVVHHHVPSALLSRSSVTRGFALACSRLMCCGDAGGLSEIDCVCSCVGSSAWAGHVFVVAVAVDDLRVGVEDALVESVVPSFLFLVWPPKKRLDAAPTRWILRWYFSESCRPVW
jgi:hypothetical protein